MGDVVIHDWMKKNWVGRPRTKRTAPFFWGVFHGIPNHETMLGMLEWLILVNR
jgi:hypothetical protein